MATDKAKSQAHGNDITSDSAALTLFQQQTAQLSTIDRVRRLGANPEGSMVFFGFYLPRAIEAEIVIYRSQSNVDASARSAKTRFQRLRFPLELSNDCGWQVLQNVRAGTRDQLGDLYWVRYRNCEGEPMHILRDPLGHSVPFGASGPTEVYRLEWPQRKDADYLRQRSSQAPLDERVGVPRMAGPSAILQIHVPTATAAGTLAGLTRQYAELAKKIERSQELTALEQSLCSYDAVQLMPIEPIIEYEGRNGFWAETYIDDGLVAVDHRRPDMTNWGYDIMTVASPAVNPALLTAGRPDEFVEFIETMHTFPGGGIQVILDIVYGHADNQSRPLLQDEFIAGPGMYGQVLDYQQPVVREILLEMQRRKSCFGIDGLRVDGAQDFKYYDPVSNSMLHDDDYLIRMNDQMLEVAGSTYLPWMVFEDGRPWPQEDWELTSTYREVTRILPNVYQWGPLTFAHNTPFLYTFWAQKWWRVREVFYHGETWITGCANHDTLRRGTQVDPEDRINSRLGSDHREIFRRGYNNPGAQLLTYAVMPGVPMDFLQANNNVPWSFIRNTDNRWAVKVVSEESRFLTWAVDDMQYSCEQYFVRLKGYGFSTLERLRSFMHHLNLAMQASEYHRETAARIMDAALPNSPLSPHTMDGLNDFARAWMDDLHEYCNVASWQNRTDEKQAVFHRELREFRRSHSFLSSNLRPEEETVFYLEPCDGSVVYAGLRHDPDSGDWFLFAVNMEGRAQTIHAVDLVNRSSRLLPQGAVPRNLFMSDAWQIMLQTPGVSCRDVGSITLHDSEGFLMMHPCRNP